MAVESGALATTRGVGGAWPRALWKGRWMKLPRAVLPLVLLTGTSLYGCDEPRRTLSTPDGTVDDAGGAVDVPAPMDAGLDVAAQAPDVAAQASTSPRRRPTSPRRRPTSPRRPPTRPLTRRPTRGRPTHHRPSTRPMSETRRLTPSDAPAPADVIDAATADAGPVGARGTPTVDGVLGDDWPAGSLVAENPTPSPWGPSLNALRALRVAWDDANLYVGVSGVVEAANALVLFRRPRRRRDLNRPARPLVAHRRGRRARRRPLLRHRLDALGLRRRNRLGHRRHAAQGRHRAQARGRPPRRRLPALRGRPRLDRRRRRRLRGRGDARLRGVDPVDGDLRPVGSAAAPVAGPLRAGHQPRRQRGRARGVAPSRPIPQRPRGHRRGDDPPRAVRVFDRAPEPLGARPRAPHGALLESRAIAPEAGGRAGLGG